MTIARTTVVSLALALLLWPLIAHAAPAPVSGTVNVSPPLPINANSRAVFYLVRADAPSSEFGRRVHSQTVFSQQIQYNFTIPDGSFSPGVAYNLRVYVLNNSNQYRAGFIALGPTGGTNVNFIAGAYPGPLPPDSAGTVALALGLLLAAVTAGLLFWRRTRLRAPPLAA